MGRSLSVVVGVPIMMVVSVIMGVVVFVLVIVPMIMRVLVTLDPGFPLAATAYCAHYSTSSSLILISSPPVTCN